MPLVRKREVMRRFSIGRTQLAEAVRAGKFPKGVPILEGGRALGWFESELDNYEESRRQARDAAAAADPVPIEKRPAPRAPRRKRRR
jgi:predicted DNA-binding transcriptional regulator AlpA